MFSGAFDEEGETVEFFVGEFFGGRIKERRDGVFDRSVEEGADDASERRAFRLIARDRWKINVSRPVVFVADVSFFFEDAEQGAHRGVTWRVGEPGANLGRGRLPQAINQIHDLTLASTQLGRVRFGFHLDESPMTAGC